MTLNQGWQPAGKIQQKWVEIRVEVASFAEGMVDSAHRAHEDKEAEIPKHGGSIGNWDFLER